MTVSFISTEHNTQQCQLEKCNEPNNAFLFGYTFGYNYTCTLYVHTRMKCIHGLVYVPMCVHREREFCIFTLFGYSRFSWGEWKTIADFTSPAIHNINCCMK